jgi:DNA-binding CsgD family transcriptional regulator
MSSTTTPTSIPPAGQGPATGFALLCGVPAVADTLAAQLQKRGLRYDPQAPVAVVLDLPRGFALHSLERGAFRQRLVVVTWSLCPAYWEDLWELGPSALVVGDGVALDLNEALACAARGQRYRLTPAGGTTLTPLERRALRLLAEGRSNDRIAEQLHLQVQSVKNTLRSVYHKLGVHNRGDALLYYWDIWRRW